MGCVKLNWWSGIPSLSENIWIHNQMFFLRQLLILTSRFIAIDKYTESMMTSSNGNTYHVTEPLFGETHGSPVDSPHKGQWCGAFDNGWANTRDAGDLKRHPAHYDVIATALSITSLNSICIICNLSRFLNVCIQLTPSSMEGVSWMQTFKKHDQMYVLQNNILTCNFYCGILLYPW